VEVRDRGRAPQIDALRGVGVVLMLVWHGCDGWLATDYRHGAIWQIVRVAGGLAAPLFCIGAGLVASERLASGTPPREIARRGAELVLLGIALRVQLWLVDGGAIVRTDAIVPASLSIAAIAIGVYGLRRDATFLALSTFTLAVAYVWMWRMAPGHLAFVAKVDVLHALGVGLIACAACARLPRPVILVIAVAIAVSAPWLGSAVSGLPPQLGAFVARNASNASLAGFPFAPWAAYALIGMAAAPLVPTRPRPVIAIASMLLAAIAFEGSPAVRALLDQAAELRSFARFVFHLASIAAIASVAGGSPTRALGRASLRIYWIHLELTFGLVALPIAQRLGPWSVALAITAMIALAARFASAIGARARGGSTSHTLPSHLDSSANSRS
jgi:uncharacterized membrane protein